jgi:hypothetical protein
MTGTGLRVSYARRDFIPICGRALILQMSTWEVERNERDIKSLAKVLFVKPFKMLFTEPMLAAITVYM